MSLRQNKTALWRLPTTAVRSVSQYPVPPSRMANLIIHAFCIIRHQRGSLHPRTKPTDETERLAACLRPTSGQRRGPYARASSPEGGGAGRRPSQFEAIRGSVSPEPISTVRAEYKVRSRPNHETTAHMEPLRRADSVRKFEQHPPRNVAPGPPTLSKHANATNSIKGTWLTIRAEFGG